MEEGQKRPLAGSPHRFHRHRQGPRPPNEYKTEEDPKLFHSIKTQRGPLSDNWIEEYKQQVFPIMCAYKLCKVEFRYWGMQSKIERFIHDTGEPAHARRLSHLAMTPHSPYSRKMTQSPHAASLEVYMATC